MHLNTNLLRFSKTIYLLVVLTTFAIICSFCKIFTFSYTLNCNRQYDYYLFLVLVPGIIFYAFKKDPNEKKLALGLIILCILFIILIKSTVYTFSNEHFYFLSLSFILFQILKSQDTTKTAGIILPVVALIFFYQITSGIYQLITMEAWKLRNVSQLRGSVINSGVYACLISSLLPLVTYYISTFSSPITSCTHCRLILSIVKITINLITAVLVIITQSRTAFVSLLILFLFFVFKKCHRSYGNISISPRIIIGSIVLLSSTIGVSLLFKTKSAVGRIMQWEIVRRHFFDNFWTGLGIGRFTYYYPKWQAEYFSETHSFAGFFRQIADESYLVNNEYIQIFKEVGFFGFFIFLTACIYILGRKHSSDHLLNAAKLTITLLLINSITLYVFHVTLMIFLFVVSIVLLSPISFNTQGQALKSQASIARITILRAVTVLLLIGAVFFGGLAHKAVLGWITLRDRKDLSEKQRALHYLKLYNLLANDGKFLTQYGEFLMLDQNAHLSAGQQFLTARQYFISYRLIEDEAKAFIAVNRKREALTNYIFLSNYTPHRFSPLYKILHLFMDLDEFDKALVLTDRILKMPVKVPSVEVDFIKNDALLVKKQLMVKLSKNRL